jgi:glucokinase
MLGSIPALLQRAALGLSGRKSRIKDFMNSKTVTIEAIAKAFHENDQLAVRLFEEEADILYHAVNNIILTVDPEIIVLSGGITLFGQPLIDRIKRNMQKTLFWTASKERKIVFTQLTENPRVYGAGMYAIESFFASPFH